MAARRRESDRAMMSGIPSPDVNILVVDDRPEDLLVVKSILDDPHYKIVTAHNGSDALRRVLEDDYALMLLDVHLPDMDGFEVAAIIKERERSRHTPIIFLTAAGADVGALYRGYSVGAVDYLVKPIDEDVLRAKVSIFVELKRKDQHIKQQAAALIEANQRARAREVAELKRASEKRYRDLAEAIPPIVWTAAPDGAVRYFNRRWGELTGQTPEQADGWGWMAAIHPDDSRAREEPWRQALASGGIYEAECRIRTREGTYRWHLCRGVPELGKRGRILGWLGTYTDCDDLKRAHAAAEIARRRSEFLAEASSLLSSSLDYRTSVERAARLAVPRLADWCVIEVLSEGGDAFPVVAGGPVSSAPAATLEQLVIVHADPTKEARVRELRREYPPARNLGGWLSDVLRTGRPELLRKVTDDALRGLAHDEAHASLLAELAPESIMCVPLVARERILGALTLASSTAGRHYDEADLSMALDLAHRAAIAVDNSRLYREVQRAVLLRDEFLSIASHELRTPLTSLLLQLETLLRMMEDKDTDPRLCDKVDKAVRQTLRLDKLTANLLDVSRIIGGRLQLELEELDAAALVREVADPFADESARAACPIRLEVLARPMARWDRLRIEQVVTNLLSNAFKYAPSAPIDVRVEQKNGHACLAVKDHGNGIALEAQARIFGRFERATDGPHSSGLGLGLYITRHIVEAHGGTIGVASDLGQGACFTVELPLAPASPLSADRSATGVGGAGAASLEGVADPFSAAADPATDVLRAGLSSR